MLTTYVHLYVWYACLAQYSRGDLFEIWVGFTESDFFCWLHLNFYFITTV